MADAITVVVVYDKLPQIRAGLRPKAENVVRKAALDIQAHAQGAVPVRTGYLKGSIQARRIGPLHWEVWVGADYGVHVEYGTRYMAARPYMRPAVDAVRSTFNQAMRSVVRP